MAQTIQLFVENIAGGKPFCEEVLVEALNEKRFRLLRSPGLLFGLAAGDEFALDEADPTRYRLLSRGGNVSIQIFRDKCIDDCESYLLPEILRLGGSLDGRDTKLLVFTVPASAGFPQIERILAEATRRFTGIEWYYGNVYADDGVTPLDWWVKK